MEERKKTFKALSHPIKAKIIQLLYESESISQGEILRSMRMGPWLLEYHLKTISELWENKDGNYRLTEKGKVAYRLTKEVRDLNSKGKLVFNASLLKRAAATVGDFALLGILMIFIKDIQQLLYLIVIAIVVATFLEVYFGRTPGKYLVKTRVISEDGRKLNLKGGIIRNIGKLLLPLDLFVGFVLFRKNGYLKVSDRYARSMVIDEEASR